MSIIRSLIALLYISLVAASTNSSQIIGTFGPLISYQPVEEWVYPANTSIPIRLSLGNASLAFSFGFQMAYGLSSTDNPQMYLQSDSVQVAQYAQMFNFTGNLLANKFWWNTSLEGLPEGSYILTFYADFSACTGGSAQLPTDLFWTNLFTVGPGGTLPANSTGNSMGSGNLTAITEGMYECTALKFAKEQVSIGLVATYTFGIIITAVIMLIVRGKDSMNL